jgi:hypothetical protein
MRRLRKYDRKVRRGYRLRPKSKVILAEGDSWFQFPVFVSDIIDWLQKRDDYMIFSIAYGGDWLTNIIYEGKYIEEISIHAPDVFLISGGGNDMVGSSRLAIMVDRSNGIGHLKQKSDFAAASYKVDDDFVVGRRYITKEFYSFLWIMKAQYWKMFDGFKSSGKLKHMQIITQGYAYAVPTYSRTWSWRYPWKSLVNALLGTGKWLKHPLMIKGIPDKEGQTRDIHRKIVKTMVHDLNEMFISLSHAFTNVYHIDSRSLIKDDHWFDELHLYSHMFKKVARAFEQCIDSYKPEEPGGLKLQADSPDSRVIAVT